MTDPNVTPQEFKRLKEQVTARMIQILTEEQGYTLEAQRGLAPLRLDYMRSLSIHKLPISFDLQVCLVCAGFDTLGDVLKLSKKEVAKVNGIAPFLRELDAIVWRSGLDYQSDK